MSNASPISGLPARLRAQVEGKDLIVFDGVCVFCSAFFKFMLRYDHQRRFAFATAQSDLGQALYRALNLPTDAFETNLILTNGMVYQRLDAFCAAMAHLGLPWRALATLRHLPTALKDPAYHLIARNRYRLFGRTETCLMPSQDLRARFLPGGF